MANTREAGHQSRRSLGGRWCNAIYPVVCCFIILLHNCLSLNIYPRGGGRTQFVQQITRNPKKPEIATNVAAGWGSDAILSRLLFKEARPRRWGPKMAILKGKSAWSAGTPKHKAPSLSGLVKAPDL